MDASSAAMTAQQVRATFEREFSRMQIVPSTANQVGVGRQSSGSSSSRGGGDVIPGFDQFQRAASYTIGGVAIGALTTRAAALTLELDKLGTQYERVNVAGAELAGGQGKLAELMDAYRDASGGAVDKMTALEQVTKLQAVGFANNAQQLERVTRAARAASLATGRDSDYVVSQMQLVVANQSTMRLDQIGVGVGEFKSRLEELKATMPGVSEEARYQEALLSVLEDKYKGLLSSAEAAASGQEMLTAAIKDLKLELAQNTEIDGFLTRLAMLSGGGNLEAIQRVIQQDLGQYRQRARETGTQLGRTPQENAELDKFITLVRGATAQGVEINRGFLNSLTDISREVANFGQMSDESRTKLVGLQQAINQSSGTAIIGGNAYEDLAIAAEDSGDSAAEAAQKLADLASETRQSAGELGYLVDIAYSAGAGLDDLGDKADSLANRLAGVREQYSGLNKVEQNVGKDILSAGVDLVPILGEVEARQRINDALGVLETSRQGWRNQGITNPVDLAILEQQLTDQLVQPMIQVKDDWEQSAKDNEQAWKSAANETERAWKDAASAFEDKVRAIPGVFGASPVTQEQKDLAAMGVPQDFADNYLRRLTDEVLNKKDWEGVDINDAARRAGIDGSLDPKAILALFTQAWQDSSLFANPANLDLLDQNAIKAEMERQKASQAGQANLLGMFGLDAQGGFNQDVYAGMMSGASDGLAQFGVDAAKNMMTQLKSEAAMQEYNSAGAVAFAAMFDGFTAAAGTSDFVGAITAEVMRQLDEAVGTP